MFIERYRVFLSLAVILFSVNAAYPQTVPYIEDVIGEDGLEKSAVDERAAEERLRLIGTFKLFNPDTVPYYLWVIFENGGKFKHTKYDDVPSVRLVDLELRYKDIRQRPMVKKFPSDNYEPREKKRFGGSWLGGGGRSGKRGARGGGAEDDAEAVVSERGYRGGRGGRGRSVYEIVFWKEDAQAYYEMELWGVLYAPDVKEAVAAGNYVENISFEIELAR